MAKLKNKNNNNIIVKKNKKQKTAALACTVELCLGVVLLTYSHCIIIATFFCPDKTPIIFLQENPVLLILFILFK